MSDYKPYLCVTQVYAKPESVKDEPGYRVSFADGWGEYSYWLPQDQFEAHHFPIQNEDKLCLDDICHMMAHTNIEATTVGDKTTLVQATLPTGFIFTEVSSCVDPKNYDIIIGKEVCMDRITSKLWHHLGFVLQWARSGLTWKEESK